MGKEHLDTKECGEMINRTAGSVRRLVMRNKIPYKKPGGRLMFLRSEIEEWINASPGKSVDEVINTND